MPSGKKDKPQYVLFDAETEEAIRVLKELYPDVTKSEIIREAIKEKAKRDAKRRKRTQNTSR